MSKDELRVSDNTAISMPMRNLLAIIAAVSVGVWAYFGVLERLNRIETNEMNKMLNNGVNIIRLQEDVKKINKQNTE